MPYFFAVLRDLAHRNRPTGAKDWTL
jgi:hypothetical protein